MGNLRKGVNMPEINNGTPQMAANTKEEVFERLRHERTIELAAEGHSFSDMKRWKLLETLNGPVYGIALYNAYYTRVVTERDYLWPFPLSECEKNPDLAKGQNPGW
ncbi:RagB/SusD family nutrient uptake outer membrane protein [Phocaeicola plebeius]|uniref:RagB/SusD family nutrient uptake outer membrane protein n=1 Tax=Phocaeicola plebeius TaxID=310297 RepID=UPI003978ECC9